jgi:hypothetical protein
MSRIRTLVFAFVVGMVVGTPFHTHGQGFCTHGSGGCPACTCSDVVCVGEKCCDIVQDWTYCSPAKDCEVWETETRDGNYCDYICDLSYFWLCIEM